MKHYDITKPIGLATPCKEIESTCNNAHMYKRCGLRPKHYIIPLDPGSGRTTLVEYMTDKYKEAGALSFTSGLCIPTNTAILSAWISAVSLLTSVRLSFPSS